MKWCWLQISDLMKRNIFLFFFLYIGSSLFSPSWPVTELTEIQLLLLGIKCVRHHTQCVHAHTKNEYDCMWASSLYCRVERSNPKSSYTPGKCIATELHSSETRKRLNNDTSLLLYNCYGPGCWAMRK